MSESITETMRRLGGEQKQNCGGARLVREKVTLLHRIYILTLQCVIMADRVPSRLNITRVDPLDGETHNVSGVFQLKFFFDVRPVSFHGFGAKMQTVCNLTNFPAFADQFRTSSSRSLSLSTASGSPSDSRCANFVI